MTGPYLTSKAAAEALGIGRSTLYRWADAGYITPAIITPAGHPRWDLDDLRRQLQNPAHVRDLPATGEPMTKPAPPSIVAAIVVSPLGVLITKRNDGKPPYGFVTGEIEPGESPADAGVREVKEEAMLEVRAGQEIGRRIHPKTGYPMIYMEAVPVGPLDVGVGDADELAEVRWAGLEEADALLPGMFEPVRDYLFRKLN
jgi:8-oxo-dGTP pyrophosphatase MutT (NUDIX family)